MFIFTTNAFDAETGEKIGLAYNRISQNNSVISINKSL